MNWIWIVCAAGLTLGVLMGLAMLLRPRGSHLSIGLGSIPEKSGGVGESRAFGGMLLAIHAIPLFFVAQTHFVANGADWEIGSAITVLGFGWLFAFLARVLSVIVDREGVALNGRLIVLDAVMALAVGAPAWATFFA